MIKLTMHREFFTADEIDDAHSLALEMHRLHGIVAELDAAERAVAAARAATEAADAAKRQANAQLTRLREERNASIAALAATLRVHELADIAGLKHPQVIRALNSASVPVPRRRRGGPGWGSRSR